MKTRAMISQVNCPPPRGNSGFNLRKSRWTNFLVGFLVLASPLFLLRGKSAALTPEEQVKDLLLRYREQAAWLAASGAPPQERLTLQKATIAEIEVSHTPLEHSSFSFKGAVP